MGKQRTPQGRPPGRGAAPPKLPAGAPAPVLADLPPTVPDAATQQADPLAQSIAQAIHEPPHTHLLDTVAIDAHRAEPHEIAADGPVPADANLSEAGSSNAAETVAAPVIAAESVDAPASHVDAAPAVEAVSETVEPAEAPAASDPYANVVPLKVPARAPDAPAVSAEPDAPAADSPDAALPAPASWRAGRRPVPPLRQDLEGMGETLFAFVRNESSAALAHLKALKDARSPADAIRLQVSEIQRAADASLTCWSEIARRATRIVVQR